MALGGRPRFGQPEGLPLMEATLQGVDLVEAQFF